MKRIMLLCLLLLLVININADSSEIAQNVLRAPCSDEGHMLLVPGVLTAGGTNRACLSRFHAEGPATMALQLVAEDLQTVSASRELPPGDGGCIDIAVPQMPNTKAELIVNIRYPEAQCSWERRITLRIGTGRVVAVHTERARYRPGDTVRARLLVLKPDLSPAHSQIDEIWLEGPRGAWEGTRAAEWKRIRTRLGIAQIQHSLDELAPPGKWTVRARLADGSQGSAAFWVGNYELPPFQLSVKHAPKVLRTSERLVWTVCVRYPWTEAVEGMLVIRIRGTGAGSESTGIRTAVRLRAPRACHRHAAAAKRVGMDGSNPPHVVVADFSFQEEGTRIWQNTTVVSQVVDKPVTLEFLTKHRAIISPELPYKLKIKATRWDDKAAAEARVRVCRSPAHGAARADCRDVTTDDAGLATVVFTAGNDGVAAYKFEASLENDTSTSAAPMFLPVQRSGSAHAALGPLKADPQAARTFVPLYLNVRNASHALTVHFVVITRGGIIYRWGATTQCPVANAADQIQTAARNSPCPGFETNRLDNQFQTNKFIGLKDGNQSDALQDRYLLRVMLPIKVTHQMCPDSHLVAYFYLNGELVSASKHFEMDECFANKAELTWSSRQTPPGVTTSLHVSTPGPALCALTALDAAAKWVQPAEAVKDVVLGGLKKLIEGHRNLSEYDTAGECFLTTDTPDLPATSTELTAAWLAASGVRVLGGNISRSRSCPASPMPLATDEAMVPRSDFSESWLWRLVVVGANGSATVSAKTPDSITRYEASSVCIARNGIAVSAPAVLQVFREFFIHADSPRRLRRGDTTIMRYRIFNYLYETLSVQIQILTDPHLEGPSEYEQSACISARSSIARRLELKAILPGAARVSVRARSVSGGCNGTTSRGGVSDEVIIQLTVDPEGIPVQEHKSMLLCGRHSPETRSSEVRWSWPPVRAVPGTEELTVWAAGDLSGPLLADADDLVLLPRGCGEQNMARMATNLLALQHLDPQSAAAATAKEHVARGFTRQLQYVHPSGGFSAFGASDAAPSTWLTAFAVRYLRKAHQTLTPGLPPPPALDRAEGWLLSQQMENGCFRNDGQVFHRELRGGLNEEGEIASVALTAYVITSLVESAILPSRVLRNALSCLRALPNPKSKSPARIYAQSLLAYTFMRLKRYEDEVRESNEAGLWEKRDSNTEGLKVDEEMKELLELLKLAKRSGDLVWWETGSLSSSIEATSYAVLALSMCAAALREAACGADARAAVRWLATHANAAGGFVATQDTLVALEALTTWSGAHPSASTNLNVTVRGGGRQRSLLLQPGARVPEIVKMGAGDLLDVYVEGTGCALVQATRSYNSYEASSSTGKLLTLEVTVHTDGPFDCDANGTACYCAAVVEACVVWSASFPSMALLEVWLPGGFGADAARLYSQLRPDDMLLRRIELTPSNTKATLYLTPRAGAGVGRGHQCYQLHAVGPRAATKPAHAALHDYYRPEVNDTQMYTIPEECPPRIIHEDNKYLASDNLFNKAKSLSNSDEIVITNEFSFEDIPEGIPLEDPLYDNLTQNKENFSSNKIQESVNKNEEAKDITNDTSLEIDVRVKEPFTDLPDDGITEDKKPNRNPKSQKISDKLADMSESNDDEKSYNAVPKTNSNDIEIIKTDYENEIPKIELINKSSGTEIVTTDKENQENNSKFQKLKSAVDETQNKEVENPGLASFHVIDSEKDLEVPSGIEGPVPAVVLPPPSFQTRDFGSTGSHRYTEAYTRRMPSKAFTGSRFTPLAPTYGPRTYETYHPAYHPHIQAYFYQPVMEDVYRNKYRFKRYNPSAG